MSDNIMKKYSPSTNEKLYEFEIMSNEQIELICSKAKIAFANWRKTSLNDRRVYLQNLIDTIRKNSDRIIQTIMLDTEKPYCEAETEVIESCDILEYYCNESFDGIDDEFEIFLDIDVWPNKKAYGIYQPIGVYAVIKPWNYPFELCIWSLAPILLAGNTVVFKPSELSTATGILLNELMKLAGFPEGVFNIVLGDASTGRHLIENDEINAISFTGSSLVGNEILNNTRTSQKKLSLEMGGSDFAIVLSDAIDEITIPGILWGSFTNAGQVCVSIEKILVSNVIYEDFVEKLVKEAQQLRLKVEIPPIISKKQYLHAKKIVDNAIKHGGKILCGNLEKDEGNYITPTIIECRNKSFLSSVEEIFAPIVFIAPFDNDTEAIEIVNSNKYGLGCSIWTKNHRNHTHLYRDLDVGMVWINEVNLPMPQLPWIGRKNSGVGFNLSKNAVYDAMELKVIHVDNDVEKRAWWYPYV